MSPTQILDNPSQPDRVRLAEIADARARQLDRHVGKRLREIREQRGLSTQQVAILVSLPEGTVIKFETVGRRLSAGRLLLFAEALGCRPEMFFEGFKGAEPAP